MFLNFLIEFTSTWTGTRGCFGMDEMMVGILNNSSKNPKCIMLCV